MELKRRSSEKETTVWIGKAGITGALLSQIEKQLKVSEMVKVKVHKTFPELIGVPGIAQKIADVTTSEIVDVRGRTFTLYRQKVTGEAIKKQA